MDTAPSKNGSQSVLEYALSYIKNGLSAIPIRRDGTKAPAIGTWSEFGAGKKDESGNFTVVPRLMTAKEIKYHFSGSSPNGIALTCGTLSGNLEMIDFDYKAETTVPAFCWLVECEAPGLLAKLTQVKTPRSEYARHFWYRCEGEVGGNDKLAREIIDGSDKTLVETRGNGGYALVPGSPAECHDTGRLYVHVSGPPFSAIKTITAEERTILLQTCRTFDASAKPMEGDSIDLLPGTDFNQRGPEFAELLEPSGWACVRKVGAGCYWRRPGKDKGWSATTGVCSSSKGKTPLFAVFSSNANPFEGAANGKVCSCYSKFGVYAFLNHGGDFKKAAGALADQGYGTTKKGPVVDLGQEIEAKRKELEDLKVKKKEEDKGKKQEEKKSQDEAIRIGFSALGFTFDAGEWQPGGWKLKIINSEPITYRLMPPFMDERGVVLTGDQFDSPLGVHKAVLFKTGSVCLADRPQAWDMLWNGYKNYRAMKAKLLDIAGREEAPVEVKRSCIVAQWLLRRLNHGRKVKDRAEIDGGSGVYKLDDGSVVFDFTYVWSEGSKSEDAIKRPEMSGLLKELGKETCWKGKKLYDFLSKTALDRLEEMVRPEDHNGRDLT